MSSSRFPTFGNKNILLYYWLTVFMNGWFILPNWVFYYARYISIAEIGIIDGLAKVVSVFLEIPSGAISDSIGKKKTLIFSHFCVAIACLMTIYSTNFFSLLISSIVVFIGFAFTSGAKEALLYDSLLEIKKEIHYEEVLGKVNSLATLTTLVSIFIGGWLFGVEPKLTFIAWLIFSLLAVLLLTFMKEPQVSEKQFSRQLYFTKLKSGVVSIFSKPVITFILPVLFISMLFKSYEGVIRQSTGAYFGFNGETFGYLLALISIPTLLVSYNYRWLADKLKNHLEYLFIGLYMLGFLLVYLTSSLYFGVASFLFVYVAQELAKPYVLSLINRQTDSSHRATAISTVSLFSEFPYMIIVLFFGSILVADKIGYLYLILFLLLGVYLAIRHFKGRPTKTIPVGAIEAEKELIYTRN